MRFAPAVANLLSEVTAASFPLRTTLTAHDRVVLRAVAEAMFSEDGEVEKERLNAHLDDVDAYISSASKPLRAGLRFALFVVRIAPVLLLFRLRMIDKLPRSERVQVLSRLERSPFAYLSLAFVGWRTVMTFVFYEHPVELATLGYSTDERKVYKRRLALVPLVPARLVPLVPLVAAPLVPVPAESGIRLRDVDLESEQGLEAPFIANDTDKVA